MFLNQSEEDELDFPTWNVVREQHFFQISGEYDFIRSLHEVNEEVAVKILFSVAIVASRMKEECYASK